MEDIEGYAKEASDRSFMLHNLAGIPKTDLQEPIPGIQDLSTTTPDTGSVEVITIKHNDGQVQEVPEDQAHTPNANGSRW